ncbi:enoyl-CoA hydratase/isomerase family protein [Rhizobium sp. 2YAF20]|uniref:enoyl-CoA hydratase/isomerase family protein n=1 Tax=Rhizobium sp. 2YAF20 TaxID=3233027 RepID=UPI003F97FD8B
MVTETFENEKISLSIGRVARLEINRPDKRNAISSAMWRALLSACERISKLREIKVLILAGTGPHFCSGADIAEFAEAYSSESSAERYNSQYNAVEAAIRKLDIPVIAELRGACFGGGLGLALSADFRFADTSTKISVTASKLGIAYSAEDSARLMEKVGAVRAKDLLFSARTIEADEAYSWGLVDRVAPSEELSVAVQRYAEDLAGRSRASLKAMKLIINSLSEPDAATCARMRPTYSMLFSGPDLQEGVAAFLAKREPVFD